MVELAFEFLFFFPVPPVDDDGVDGMSSFRLLLTTLSESLFLFLLAVEEDEVDGVFVPTSSLFTSTVEED